MQLLQTYVARPAARRFGSGDGCLVVRASARVCNDLQAWRLDSYARGREIPGGIGQRQELRFPGARL